MKKLLIYVPLFVTAIGTMAQKLPTTQKESVFAPANIKIDGKATEWDNLFHAYNNATDVFYTLSNDNNNLYLIVQAKKHDIVDRLIRGGITLTVNHTVDKKDKSPVTITYPILRGADGSAVANGFAAKSFTQKDKNDNNKWVDPDSNFNELNTVLGNRSKLINISGIKEIQDEAISVYNETGIKAASRFDQKLAYTIELAIPLKYLALPDNAAPFNYQIKVNPPYNFDHPPSPGSGPPGPPMMITNTVATDMRGEYTLAKE